MKVYQYEVSIHAALLRPPLGVRGNVCRVSRVRVKVRVRVRVRVSRVSYPGQPCEYTSNGYTHSNGRS